MLLSQQHTSAEGTDTGSNPLLLREVRQLAPDMVDRQWRPALSMHWMASKLNAAIVHGLSRNPGCHADRSAPLKAAPCAEGSIVAYLVCIMSTRQALSDWIPPRVGYRPCVVAGSSIAFAAAACLD